MDVMHIYDETSVLVVRGAPFRNKSRERKKARQGGFQTYVNASVDPYKPADLSVV